MRLFFALWPPPPLAQGLATVAQGCAQRFGGKPAQTETIHLTLAFLGEQTPERFVEIVTAARGVRMTPFDLAVDLLACWRHNRLLWAGCVSPPEGLLSLAEALRQALRLADIRFDDEARRFTPHLTLVRKLPEATFSSALPSLEPLVWRCDGFALIESQLSAAGPAYRIVAEFGGD